MSKLYRRWKDAPIATLEPHYSRHVAAMTAEALHAKSDIAAELAWRDVEAAVLREQVARLKELLADGVAFLEMDDCEVGDDVWVWLHTARDALATTAPTTKGEAK